MIDLILAALGGALVSLVVLYRLGKRHQRYAGRASGPTSRVPVAETVVAIVKKG
jgi:hypothetical protein